MLNFAVCDDNIIILNRLVKMLESIFIEKNLDAKVSFYTASGEELLNYTNENTVDVLILDIDLKSKYSGLELAEIIRKENKNIYIIFSTAHLEYALVAYKFKTFDYLPKPVSSERLEETIFRIFDDYKSNTKKTHLIRIANSRILVNENDIQYIRKDGMKLIYHTPTKAYETYSSFAKIENTLPSNFIRCHKSYIVNVNNITTIEANNTINFTSDTCCCSIGPKYKNNLMEVFTHGNFSKYLDSVNN